MTHTMTHAVTHAHAVAHTHAVTTTVRASMTEFPVMAVSMSVTVHCFLLPWNLRAQQATLATLRR